MGKIALEAKDSLKSHRYFFNTKNFLGKYYFLTAKSYEQ